ncbi:MAG: beta-hydroxyacyl-ACP dehydratase [Planctomycetes bacterium]|nr:beta-hydroxyacyl-ACP dehydratase [Planctomycetota bacterium]
MGSAPFIDPADLDLGRVLYDRAAIRRFNPQREPLEGLDAVVLFDQEAGLIAGYRDIRSDEFWVPGHIPGRPLLPGVLMCESAAQLCSFYIGAAGLVGEGYFIGFAGLEAVRFRGEVRPGDRLVLLARRMEIRSRTATFDAQGLVGARLVFEGRIIGVRLPLVP